MLNLVRAMLSSRDSRELNAAIRESVDEGKKSYLIVPEQDTVMRESELAKLLPSSAPLCFEVTNFTRFADSTLRTLGGISGEYGDKSKKALVMWRALTELAPFLSTTGSGGEVSGSTVSQALSAVAQMQSAGITPTMLSEAASSEAFPEDRRLLSKAEDLARIYTLYKKLLSERFSDTSDGADAANGKLLEHPDYLKGARIFIDGFTSFTEPQYRLITTLSRRAEVTLRLPLPKHREELFEYREPAEALESLKRFIRKDGQDIRITYDHTTYGTAPAIAELSDNLWRKNSNFDNITLQRDDEIRVFEAPSPYEMCDFVAADIKRRVMAGDSYSDFAVIARRAESYKGIIDCSLSDAGIPCFLSYPRDIGELEAIKLIYTAYATLRSGFAREDVITYSKCGLVGISRDECDEFESYVNTWRLSGSVFLSEDDWNMSSTGYFSARRPDESELIQRINSTPVFLRPERPALLQDNCQVTC